MAAGVTGVANAVALLAIWQTASAAFGTYPYGVALVALSYVGTLGLLNCFLVYRNQKLGVKLRTSARSAEALHRVTEIVRDYRALKQDPAVRGVTAAQVHEHIARASEAFLDTYMAHQHNGDTRMTVKYRRGDRIYSLRTNHPHSPPDDYEEVEECHLFQIFQDRQKRGHIYVQNISDLAQDEREALGERAPQVCARALGKRYATFIAVPVNTGDMSRNRNYGIRTTIGLVGFDQRRPYMFGDGVPQEERETLYAFADAISELVYDCDSPELDFAHEERRSDGP